jgi:two-component system sensor histidine kinase CpxA
VLFLKSANASANGLFFDYSPWLLGGLAVLGLSVALWAPFVLGITRYAGRISKATARIADGHFDTKLGASRNDELGAVGESIEEMSARLGHLISGQKRFLGDVAHELCAPLARMRTGLGILQNGADARQAERLASIEEDAEELSALVSELLAFTKANSSPANPESIPLAEFCRDLASRELEGHAVEIAALETVSVRADRKLLARALRNVLRNCHLHAGADCSVRISANASGDTVNLVVEDNGPGVEEGELPRLFEPFYRPDKSRTRDTGGTGLGMAIVESSVRACGGKVSAGKSEMGGLLVSLVLPKG